MAMVATMPLLPSILGVVPLLFGRGGVDMIGTEWASSCDGYPGGVRWLPKFSGASMEIEPNPDWDGMWDVLVHVSDSVTYTLTMNSAELEALSALVSGVLERVADGAET